ncbi:MAG: glutamate--cysteine ligase [Proteobacteria bacterium]|nr:glutamate--cysteine ligase [Pseudomonadota bacterium]
MSNYSLFSVVGIEIEYMLVDRELNVSPKSSLLLEKLAGKIVNEASLGEIAASNELVMHVIELKNNGPKPPASQIAQDFQKAIEDLKPHLYNLDLQLLPSGAHPWMDPLKETLRWPHGNRDIYQQYDQIFNCEGHGFANLQSMHVNLPFANDDEFSKLHNAIRLILPLIPAIAASTPFLDGKKTELYDARLHFYAKNQQRIPSISGHLIPEFICSEEEYQQKILQPMYKDISPFDKEGILQHEWLNSRAAIPKFNYKAIEIRIIDSQECVKADIAIALALIAILKHWIYTDDYFLKNPMAIEPLKQIFNATIKTGFNTEIDNANLCTQWQLPKRKMTARQIWALLIEKVSTDLDQVSQQVLERILSEGSLSERLIKACGNDFSTQTFKPIYRELSHCLMNNQLFDAR